MDTHAASELIEDFNNLAHQVDHSLRRQIGDATQLLRQSNEVLRFRVQLTSSTLRNDGRSEHHIQVNYAKPFLDLNLFNTMRAQLQWMLDDLDIAHRESLDPSDGSFNPAQRIRTGRRGRPRVVISKEWLERALTMRNVSGVAASLPVKTCARVVRKEALRHGLLTAGKPLFETIHHDDGTTSRVRNQPRGEFSTLTDLELDKLVSSILQNFPRYGRGMIKASLLQQGHRVQRSRVRESYVRVNGNPRVWGDRTIQRRPYCVAGPNSLWHHDGQHGELFSYKR